MSISDAHRIIALETTVAELIERVQALEERLAEALQLGKSAEGATPVLPLVPLDQRLPDTPIDDAVMARVVAACSAGLSIRGAADRLGIDRNKVARLRQRAIAEGCLTVSPN